VQDQAGLGPDGDGQRVGDGVVDGQELELEVADLEDLALLDGVKVEVADAVLPELRGEERQRQLGSEDGVCWPASSAGRAPRRCGPHARA